MAPPEETSRFRPEGSGAWAYGLCRTSQAQRDIRLKAVTSPRKCQWGPWGTGGTLRVFIASFLLAGPSPSPAGVRLFTLRGARDVGEGLGSGDWKASRSPELSRGLPPPSGPPPGPVRGPVASCVSSSLTAAARPPTRGKRKLH